MGLHTLRRFGPASGGMVDFGRIDVIAHAMDHGILLLHLRVIVNNFANDFHLDLQIEPFRSEV